jgi:hypothetical protein
VIKRPSMRLIPIGGRFRIDLQRHGELQGWARCFFHHVTHDFDRRLYFRFRHFKDLFVMHLQKHACGQTSVFQRAIHAHHGTAYNISRRALNGRVDRGTFIKRALGWIG